MTASEEGMSDYNAIDVIREAHATVVAAAQSTTSFIPPLGREKARVLTLNLRNRMIFKAADEDGAVESADFLGKKKFIRRTWGFSHGKTSSNYSEQEEHIIKPYVLRGLANRILRARSCRAGLQTLHPPAHPARWGRYQTGTAAKIRLSSRIRPLAYEAGRRDGRIQSRPNARRFDPMGTSPSDKHPCVDRFAIRPILQKMKPFLLRFEERLRVARQDDRTALPRTSVSVRTLSCRQPPKPYQSGQRRRSRFSPTLSAPSDFQEVATLRFLRSASIPRILHSHFDCES